MPTKKKKPYDWNAPLDGRGEGWVPPIELARLQEEERRRNQPIEATPEPVVETPAPTAEEPNALWSTLRAVTPAGQLSLMYDGLTAGGTPSEKWDALSEQVGGGEDSKAAEDRLVYLYSLNEYKDKAARDEARKQLQSQLGRGRQEAQDFRILSEMNRVSEAEQLFTSPGKWEEEVAKATADYKAAGARRQTAEDYYSQSGDYLTRTAGDVATNYESLGSIGGGLVGTALGAYLGMPQVGGTIGAMAGSGPMAKRAYNSAFTQAVVAGMSEEDARNFGLAMSSTEFLFEAAGGKLFSKVGLDGVIQQQLKKRLLTNAGRNAGATGLRIAGGGAEEGLTTLGQAGMTEAWSMLDDDPKMREFLNQQVKKDGDGTIDWASLGWEATRSAAVGSAQAGAFATPMGMIQTAVDNGKQAAKLQAEYDSYIKLAEEENKRKAPKPRVRVPTAPAETALAEAPVTPQEQPERRRDVLELQRLSELRALRRNGKLTSEQTEELADLTERDRLSAKVAGRRLNGVQTMEARNELEDAGKLKPVQAFADADNFKSVNDELGHDVGDTVIRNMGELFAKELGEGNVFHRGGDEFILQADTQEQLDSAMARVRDTLGKTALRSKSKDGTPVERTGVGFSYGTGTTAKEAEDALHLDKEARKKAGLRTDRNTSKKERPAAEELDDMLSGLRSEGTKLQPSATPKKGATTRQVIDAITGDIDAGDTQKVARRMEAKNLVVVERDNHIPAGAEARGSAGYYDGKRTYIVANRLDPNKPIVGQMLDVLAHETVHVGDVSGNLDNRLVGKENNKKLNDQIQSVAAKQAKQRGITLEDVTAMNTKETKKLPAELRAYHYATKHTGSEGAKNLEMVAYYVNFARESRGNATLLKNIKSAVNTNFGKYLPGNVVKLDDIAYLSDKLLRQAALSDKPLTGDVGATVKNYGKDTDQTGKGLSMIAGRKSTGFTEAQKQGIDWKGFLDQKDRFEIPDHKAEINEDSIDTLSTGKELPISKVLDHETLYKNYPEGRIPNIKVRVDDSVQGDASYVAETNTIRLNPLTVTQAQLSFEKGDDFYEEFRNVILHEVQHAVQEEEGFASGASSRQWIPEGVTEEYNKAVARYYKSIKNFDLGLAIRNMRPEDRAIFNNGVQAHDLNTVEAKALYFLKEGFHRDNRARLIQGQGNEYERAVAAKNKASEDYRIAGMKSFKKYLSASGEMEARNTEYRSRKDPDMLRKVVPEATLGWDKLSQTHGIKKEDAHDPGKAEEPEQVAYHGTPHTIEKRFSLHKIGTGEGAQAYGWGLYFAGRKEIAEHYRNKLAGGDTTAAYGPIKQMQARANEEPGKYRVIPDDGPLGNDNAYLVRRSGNLYAVDIPEDSDLLDYDKPMEDNPPAVRKRAERLWNALPEWYRDEVLDRTGAEFDDLTGSEFYQVLGKFADEGGMPGIYDHPQATERHVDGKEAASHALYVAGIPGMRYLDGGSRGKGEGSHNYVIWDEASISEPTGLAMAGDGSGFNRENVPDEVESGNTKRVIERLFAPGGFLDSELEELLRHASNLPASKSVDALYFNNHLREAVDANVKNSKGEWTDETFRKMLTERIDKIDKLETLDEREFAMAALDREFPGVGKALNELRNFKVSLTRDLIMLRKRDPKKLTDKERATYAKMVHNAERYTTRAYLATYDNELGKAYGKRMLKQYKKDPDSKEGQIVQKALDYLVNRELVIPDQLTLINMPIEKVRRIYENWIGPSDKTMDEVGKLAMVQKLVNLPPAAKAEIDAKAWEIVNEMLGQTKEKGKLARDMSPSKRQNRTILEARSDIPVELRNLLGEITDPLLREAISLNRMINLSVKTKLLTELYENGKDKWWSETKTPKFHIKMSNVAYGPLDGKWISQDLADAVTGTVVSMQNLDEGLSELAKDGNLFMRTVFGQAFPVSREIMSAQKTWSVVANVYNGLVNLAGAGLIMATMNGLPMFFGKSTKGMKGAGKTLLLDIWNRKISRENAEIVKELLMAGVTDSATMGEFKGQAYDDVRKELAKLGGKEFTPIDILKGIWRGLAGKHDLGNAMRTAYAFMDVWVKAATYYDRKDFNTRMNKLEGWGLTEEQIIRKSGYEASGTNVSYERTLPVVKMLERNIPLFMFLTYKTETVRATYMSVAQIFADLKTANKAKTPEGKRAARAMALKRLVGTTAALGTVIGGTLYHLADEDDEERKKRALDLPWMQNVTLIELGKDKDGNPVMFNMNRVDPVGPMNEMLISYLNAPEGEKATVLANQLEEFLFAESKGFMAMMQFVSDAGVAAVASVRNKESIRKYDMDIKRNGIVERNYPKLYATLQKVPGDMGENLVEVVERTFLPGSLKPFIDDRGKTDSTFGEVVRMLGMSMYVRNPKSALQGRIIEFDQTIDILNKEKRELIKSGNIDVESLTELREREYRAFSKLSREYDGFMAFDNVNAKDAMDIINNKKLFQQLRTGAFRSTLVDRTTLTDWYKREVKKPGADKKEVRETYYMLRQLYSEVQ